ncbi:MAG: beta-Ala-His dipeptidase [Victivallales bacterium]|jgi:dipeptidase D|nr:beta-Ala-His dipeptidase [Victivallales bacterium]
MKNSEAFPEPRELWRIFELICQTPHPSGHEKLLAKKLIAFAQSHALKVSKDAFGNLRFDRPASPGFEERKQIILQGHLDMVPQAKAGVSFDFILESIPTEIQGSYLHSSAGTTLGADNGIGVAAALALLTNESFCSGPLAAVFTLSEEVGLNGAMAIDPELLKGDYLLNLDSEDEGELFIGCAGGSRLEANLPIETEPTPPGMAGAILEITNLAGGHSGCNISDRRGNAVIFLGLALQAAKSLRVASMQGGSLDNAIPREATAAVALDPRDRESVIARLNELKKQLCTQYRLPKEFTITLTNTTLPARVFREDFQHKIVQAIATCPDGVLEYDPRFDVPGVSTNLAAVLEQNGILIFRSSQRGLSDDKRRKATELIVGFFESIGAKTCVDNEYPGWTPSINSELLRIACTLYSELFGSSPQVKVIHAGLECGIFAGKRPGLEMISFGPTILDPHSPSERVDIDSVERFYSFLGALISAL